MTDTRGTTQSIEKYTSIAPPSEGDQSKEVTPRDAVRRILEWGKSGKKDTTVRKGFGLPTHKRNDKGEIEQREPTNNRKNDKPAPGE
jgi:hypothetical protein